MVQDQLAAIDIEADLILEPMRRDSGPAIAAGALLLASRQADGLMLVLAADHIVSDEQAFLTAVRRAAGAAVKGAIVTFGIEPDHPATGYGYIKPGQETQDEGVRCLEAFIEKPDATRAARFGIPGQ